MARTWHEAEAVSMLTLITMLCTSVLKLLTLCLLLTFHSVNFCSAHAHHLLSFFHHMHTGCNHLRAPTASAALSKTGNVSRSDQHKLFPKHDNAKPGVRGAAGAAEICFC